MNIDPSQPPFQLQNLSGQDLTVQQTDLPPGKPAPDGSPTPGPIVTVQAPQYIAFARDALLRALVDDEDVALVLYGDPIVAQAASDWLNKVGKGDIIIS
jgi:hypothetical protein